jgi:hypothetical protein
MKRAIVALCLVACASDPAEFRPAKSARDYPAVKAAYRIHSVDAEACEPIGVVHSDGRYAIDDIAETAANHGGTHYVVRDDNSSYSYATRGVAMPGPGNTAIVSSSTTPVRHRRVWAQVYRCQ